ncbi:hypothetical protein [Paenibacillus phytorum]|nr:hypothetical protein [Paenibacillus phytorum]
MAIDGIREALDQLEMSDGWQIVHPVGIRLLIFGHNGKYNYLFLKVE